MVGSAVCALRVKGQAGIYVRMEKLQLLLGISSRAGTSCSLSLFL